MCLQVIIPSVCFQKNAGDDASRRRRSGLQLNRGRLQSRHRPVNVHRGCQSISSLRAVLGQSTMGTSRDCRVSANIFSSPAAWSSPTVRKVWYSSHRNMAGRKMRPSRRCISAGRRLRGGGVDSTAAPHEGLLRRSQPRHASSSIHELSAAYTLKGDGSARRQSSAKEAQKDRALRARSAFTVCSWRLATNSCLSAGTRPGDVLSL